MFFFRSEHDLVLNVSCKQAEHAIFDQAVYSRTEVIVVPQG